MRRIGGEGQPLPVAVIGTGSAGGYILNGLEKMGATRVVGYETEPQQIARARQKHSGLIEATDMQDALRKARGGIVYFTTPDHVRGEIIDQAYNDPTIAGVVIAKPLANNLARAEEIATLARETGKPTIIATDYRATPQFAAIKEGFDRGEIGDFVGGHVTYDHDLREHQDPWRKKGEGQNFYYGALAHGADTLINIAGDKVTAVTTKESRLGLLEGEDGFNRPERITTIFEFDNGALATASVNLVTPLPQGEHGTMLIVEGTEGKYMANNKVLPGRGIIPESEGSGNKMVEYLITQGGDGWTHRRVKQAFTSDLLVVAADNWVKGESDNPYPFATIEDGMRTMYVLDAAERSAKSNRTEIVVYQLAA